MEKTDSTARQRRARVGIVIAAFGAALMLVCGALYIEFGTNDEAPWQEMVLGTMASFKGMPLTKLLTLTKPSSSHYPPAVVLPKPSDFKPVGSSLAFGNEARKISGLPVVHQTVQLPSASFHVNDDNVLKDEAPKDYSGDGLLTEEGQLGLAKQRKMAMDFQADAMHVSHSMHWGTAVVGHYGDDGVVNETAPPIWSEHTIKVLEQRKDIVSRFLPEAGMLHDPNRKDYKDPVLKHIASLLANRTAAPTLDTSDNIDSAIDAMINGPKWEKAPDATTALKVAQPRLSTLAKSKQAKDPAMHKLSLLKDAMAEQQAEPPEAKDKNPRLSKLAKAKDKNPRLSKLAKAKDKNPRLSKLAKAKDIHARLSKLAERHDSRWGRKAPVSTPGYKFRLAGATNFGDLVKATMDDLQKERSQEAPSGDQWEESGWEKSLAGKPVQLAAKAPKAAQVVQLAGANSYRVQRSWQAPPSHVVATPVAKPAKPTGDGDYYKPDSYAQPEPGEEEGHSSEEVVVKQSPMAHVAQLAHHIKTVGDGMVNDPMVAKSNKPALKSAVGKEVLHFVNPAKIDPA